MHAPSSKAVACLPGYLTILSFCLKSVCGESYGSPKNGFRQFFAPSSLKYTPRSEEEYSEGEMSCVVLSEIFYIIWLHWFRDFVKQKIHLENGTVVQVLKPVIKGHLEIPTTCCSHAQKLIR